MKRRNFLINTANAVSLICLSPIYLGASNTVNYRWEKYVPNSPEYIQPDLIPVPENPEEWLKFRESLINWRKETKEKLNYDDSLYNSPDFKWVASAYNCYFLMMYDELFYNREVDKYK